MATSTAWRTLSTPGGSQPRSRSWRVWAAGPAPEVERAAEGCRPVDLLAVEHPAERGVGVGAGLVPGGQPEAVGEGVGGTHGDLQNWFQ